MDDTEIIEYKKSAWQGTGDSCTYSKNVDNLFFNAVIKKIFLTYIKPGFKVFDMGAGTGRLSFALADYGCEVLASDISKDMISHIERNKDGRNIKTMIADGEFVDGYLEQFDAVTSLSFMSHFPNWANFLKIKSKLCKKGGYIIFNFRNRENFNHIDHDEKKVLDYLFNGDFLSSCPREEFEKICSDIGLEVVKVYPISFFSENALFHPYLTKDEVKTFTMLFGKLLASPKILDILTKFEEEIIQKSDEDVCSDTVVVLRKK